ncbi:uncharacterized protein [Bemisia tabaci]|uniref:uncharacterized protein isoform X3 n=1 Tax=Bemisia tabaci TaxID=7038 RepID=UPI003B28A789
MCMVKVLITVAALVVSGGSSAPLSRLSFEKGDLLKTSRLGFQVWRHFNLPPHHYYYALSDHEIFSTTVEPQTEYYSDEVTKKVKLRSVLYTLDVKTPRKEFDSILMTKARVRGATIGDTGIALARRMSQMVLFYHTTRCNNYHYIDYVVHGKTFGRWWKPLYWPKHPECPVHLVIESETNVSDPTKPGYVTSLRKKKGEEMLPHLKKP